LNKKNKKKKKKKRIGLKKERERKRERFCETHARIWRCSRTTTPHTFFLDYYYYYSCCSLQSPFFQTPRKREKRWRDFVVLLHFAADLLIWIWIVERERERMLFHRERKKAINHTLLEQNKKTGSLEIIWELLLLLLL